MSGGLSLGQLLPEIDRLMKTLGMGDDHEAGHAEREGRRIAGFTFLRHQTFESGGHRHTVAIYRCDLFARALGLAENASDPACEFVLVPAGTFDMGSVDGDPDERPVRRVRLRSFLLGRTEVTQAVWDAVWGWHPTPDWRRWRGERLPIEGVSWDDAQRFVRAAGLRLPSEAEWEHACQAGTRTPWSFGAGESDAGEHAWHKCNSDSRTQPVAQKLPNAFGLFDMHGNVSEWCQDVSHGSYEGAPVDGSAWERAGGEVRLRVCRGGGWTSKHGYLRSAFRNHQPREQRFSSVGLRAAVGL